MEINSILSLPWDSNFFGYSVGKIIATSFSADELEMILKDARKNNVRLLYAFIDPNNRQTNEVAKIHKGLLVDEKITYVKNLSLAQLDLKENKKNIVFYKNKPLTNNLTNLAIGAGLYSRFRLDPHFAFKTYEKLYTKWIANSLNGSIAADVLVYAKDNKEVGLLTLGIKGERADIGLLSVDASMQGKGVGTALLAAAEQQAISLGKKVLEVVTQAKNIPACHLYEKCGFTKEHIENIYHFWLTEDNENSF